jgi:DNA modification methylase
VEIGEEDYNLSQEVLFERENIRCALVLSLMAERVMLEKLKSKHKLIVSDSRYDIGLSEDSVDLIVTSPPYPMIGMWDKVFIDMNPIIGEALLAGDVWQAFELMHHELDKVWKQAYRLLRSGGVICINIGDATRTVDNRFRLFPNHSRVQQSCVGLGFDSLPVVIWRKTTNAPNKFMGSGMLPAGAYVTLEHEYILVLRKGAKREFPDPVSKNWRQASALLWEE